MCTPWPFIGTNNTFGWGVGGHGGAHSAAAATAMQCGKCHFGHFPHWWQQSTCPPCGHTQGQQMCQKVPKGGALARWVPCVPGCSPQPHACPQLKVGMPPWHPTWVMAGAAGHGHAPWVARMHAHNASKAAGPTQRPTASPFASLVAHPKVATMPLWAPGPHGRPAHPWGAWGHTHVHCQCALKASGGGHWCLASPAGLGAPHNQWAPCKCGPTCKRPGCSTGGTGWRVCAPRWCGMPKPGAPCGPWLGGASGGRGCGGPGRVWCRQAK